jgi:putative transposase
VIDKDGSLSVRKQCALLDLRRSTFYHPPEPVSDDDLAMVSLINRCHLKYPFYGSRRTRGWLIDEGYCANRKRFQRPMRTMGLETLYPGRSLSKANQASTVVAIVEHYGHHFLYRCT